MSAAVESWWTLLQEGLRAFECVLAGPSLSPQFVEARIDDDALGDCFETTLVGPNCDRRECCKFVGPLERIGETTQSMNAPLRKQLLGRVHAGAKQHVSGDGPTELVTRTFDRPLVDRESQLCGGNSESTGGTCHAQITCQRELRTRSHRRPVDGRKRDAGQRCEPAQCRTEGIRKVVALDAGQVGSRTESRRLTRQDDDPRHTLDCVLMGNDRSQRLEVDGISSVRPSNRDHRNVRALPIKGDRTATDSAGTFFPVQPYHQHDCMTSGNPSPSSPVDPVRERRAQVAKYTLLANRVGYLLYAGTIACFVFAFALGFNSTMVGVMTFGLIAGSILLAPSIVLGYAVKAAEREDREREQAAGQ